MIDLRGAEYFSSAGLRSVLVLGKHVKSLGGKMALCGLQGLVRETFTISGFLTLFPVADDPEAAAALAAGAPRAPKPPAT